MIRPVFALCACILLAACAAPGQRVALPSAPPPGEPGNVAGLSPAQIRVAFGEPAFVRKDGKTEIWRYDGAVCKGFFFFSPSDAGLSVRHVETVPRGHAIAADSGCLNSLLIRKTVPTS
ncbi:MAG: hypothetical protein ACREHE_00655 [Rhizomicrobium sp.]